MCSDRRALIAATSCSSCSMRCEQPQSSGVCVWIGDVADEQRRPAGAAAGARSFTRPRGDAAFFANKAEPLLPSTVSLWRPTWCFLRADLILRTRPCGCRAAKLRGIAREQRLAGVVKRGFQALIWGAEGKGQAGKRAHLIFEDYRDYRDIHVGS